MQRSPSRTTRSPRDSLAENGVTVGRHLADVIGFTQQRFIAGTPLANELVPNGQPLAYRSTWKRPALAKTLARFGREGATPFYSGDIATKIVEAARAEGSAMEASDLANYKVRERAAAHAHDRDAHGRDDARAVGGRPHGPRDALDVRRGRDLAAQAPASARARTSTRSPRSCAARSPIARESRAIRISTRPSPRLSTHALDPKQLEARQKRIEPYKTHNATEFKTREEGTSHLIVTDDEGNVVSLTTTVNGPFGARIVAGDTGIILNNELDDFSAQSDMTPFGVQGGGPNRPRGNARPVSSMAPTIVLENGEPIVALGGSGGRRIATEVTQAALARLVFGLDPGVCVSAPRMFTNGANLVVDPEVAEDVRAALRLRGETVEQETFNGTGVQMIGWDRPSTGVKILAASDPRKLGFAAAL